MQVIAGPVFTDSIIDAESKVDWHSTEDDEMVTAGIQWEEKKRSKRKKNQ